MVFATIHFNSINVLALSLCKAFCWMLLGCTKMNKVLCCLFNLISSGIGREIRVSKLFCSSFRVTVSTGPVSQCWLFRCPGSPAPSVNNGRSLLGYCLKNRTGLYSLSRFNNSWKALWVTATLFALFHPKITQMDLSHGWWDSQLHLFLISLLLSYLLLTPLLSN